MQLCILGDLDDGILMNIGILFLEDGLHASDRTSAVQWEGCIMRQLNRILRLVRKYNSEIKLIVKIIIVFVKLVNEVIFYYAAPQLRVSI